MIPIADLHCDLLCYLANDKRRTALDADVRCSLDQLEKGGVFFQTLAVFTHTAEGSLARGFSQLQEFVKLQRDYPERIKALKPKEPISINLKKINCLLALENASCLIEEKEPIERFFSRIEETEKQISKILYITPTWNQENRFGGGALSKVGLKEDGLVLLNYLHEKEIAIDLSHASDALAFAILNTIDKKNLQIPVMASHSNFRAITNVPRNLPEELVLEIIKRQGLIGITFYKSFVGKDDSSLLIKHLEYLFKLKGQDCAAIGADFFCGLDLPVGFEKPLDELFFPEYNDASHYPKVIDLWQKNLKLTKIELNKLTFGNFMRFYQNQIVKT